MENRFSKLESSLESSSKKNTQILTEIVKKFSSHSDFLEEVLESMKTIDETLCNVLLAIRQNEYLQAYYPAQSGFQELKVSGIHPANVKNKRKKIA